MADYYPLIARAVAGLDKNTGEIRRALYERARTALVGQLRSVDPPLNESDITRERLALEESIRKVETEASRRRPEAAEEGRPSLSDEGLRGFRAVVAEAEGLGDAAAEANRAAHEVYEAVPTDQPPYEEQPAEAVEEHVPKPLAADEPMPLEPAVVDDLQYSQEQLEEHPQEAPPSVEPHDEPAWRPAPSPPHFDDDRHVDEHRAYVRPARSYGRLIKIVLLLLIVAGAAGAAYWQRNALTSLVASLRSAPPTQQQQAAQPAGRPKITDRVGGGTAPNSANAPAAAVAQKVVLYDEDPTDPQGKRYVGSALWRIETVSPGPGLAPEIAVRADVEIPERHMRMTWSLRRNTDKALPASHTIEVMFTLPADFPEGGIGNVPGVLMKADEQARGVPLAGLAVKVTNGYFLIGLSAVEVDVQRNLQLLKERNWFDIPVVYTSGKRAILAIEKGTPGARVFEEALRAWGQ
jgi:hypothetical protein